ncbi:unnamed protein product [Aphanomyces euteiches]
MTFDNFPYVLNHPFYEYLVPDKMQQHPSFLLLGDSITQQGSDPRISGFQALLQGDYIRRVDVINRGLSGYNTWWFLDTLPQILNDAYADRTAPLLITLFLGANDATPEGRSQYVSLTDYDKNLHSIINLLRHSFPSSKVLLITPPAISDSRDCGRRNDVAEKYAIACQAVGKALSVPVVDVWTPMQDDRNSYLSDGLHLNAKGNLTVYNALTAQIKASYPELVPDNIPFYYLPWTSLAEADAKRNAQ